MMPAESECVLEPEALRITPIEARASVRLKAWESGCPRPELSGFHLKQLGPGEWLVVSDTVDGPTLLAVIEKQVQERPIVVVDVSHGLRALRVSGPSIREVLAKGCGLDLHPRVFPPTSCTRTRLARLPVIVHCVDPKPHFDLYVGRSHVLWLTGWLKDAAAEFCRRGAR
jgi:heterotetrameric sarcosine oxidase gamma subunit